MAELGQLRIPRRAQALANEGLPGRLRAVLARGGWARRREPQVRYGQTFLPGLQAVVQRRPDLGPSMAVAEAARRRELIVCGERIALGTRIDWSARDRSDPWRIELNGLDALVAVGLAGAVAPSVEERRDWYRVAAGLAREWVDARWRGVSSAWEVPALTRRIPNMIHLAVLFAPELRADPDVRRVLLTSLYQQTEALAAAVAARGADPWQIAAGRTLFMAGRFFDGLEARAWLEAGTTLLWGQLREQVNDDGGHASRDLRWHAFVLAEYLEALAVLRASTEDVPPWGRKRVKGMADFLARLVHPDGEMPLFHGGSMAVIRPAEELLAAASVLLHEPGLAGPGDLPGVWPLLLVGEPGARAFASLARRSRVTTARALRRTGYYILPGAPGDGMVLDGDDPPAGGDRNVFGYELSVGGMRMVVDGGPFGSGPRPWAEHFAGPTAHNGVAVRSLRDTSAAPPVGGAVADVQWLARDGMLCFIGTHENPTGTAPDVRHRRWVFCRPSRFWVVVDELSGVGEWEMESFVHLHPEVRLRARCQGRPVIMAERGGGARLQVLSAGAAAMEVVSGVESPDRQGWHAPAPGRRRATPTIVLGAEGRLPLLLAYALLPRVDGSAALSVSHDGFHVRTVVELERETCEISALPDDLDVAVRPL